MRFFLKRYRTILASFVQKHQIANISDMSDKKIYMTPACADRFRAELKDLLYKERPQMVETVAWAASNGDRSENADYHYGKRRLRQIDGRIRFSAAAAGDGGDCRSRCTGTTGRRPGAVRLYGHG